MNDTLKVVRIDMHDGIRFYGGYRANGFHDSGVILFKSVCQGAKFSYDIAKMACKQVKYLGYEAMVVDEKDAKRAYRESRVGA